MKIHAGTFFGIPLFVHWSWFVFLVIVDLFYGHIGLMTTITMFLFVVLHEYGHCVMAKYINVPVEDVTIYPIGGIARLQFPIGGAKEEFLIAIAGPLVNLMFAIIFIGACFFFTIPAEASIEETWASQPVFVILSVAAALNTILLLFNMLPIFPMDGGRVLRSVLVMVTHNFLLATTLAIKLSQLLCLAMMCLGVYVQSPLLPIIFFLMFLGAQNELIVAKHYTSIHNLKCKAGFILGRPELASASLSQVIAALEDVKDEDLRERLQTEELIPLLKDLDEEDQRRFR